MLRFLMTTTAMVTPYGRSTTVPARSVLLNIKRATKSATLTNYKRILMDEIRSNKKLSLVGDVVALEQQMEDFHLPLYVYLKNILDQNTNKRPLLVGISAPQGCGKTTLTELLRVLFKADGRRCLSVSLDDFYLKGAAQDELACAHPANPLLQYRGNAGTHDMPLIETTLAALGQPAAVRVPQYDKALRDGRGDRVPDAHWLTLDAPPDVVLFEGWMLGFSPVGDSPGDVDASNDGVDAAERARRQAVLAARPGLREVDRLLRGYRALHEAVDAWLVIAVEDEESLRRSPAFNPNSASEPLSADDDSGGGSGSGGRPAGVGAVHRWRLQAETAMRAAGRAGLSDAQVADFVERFMPAYELYLPTLYRRGPERRGAEVPVLQVTVDIDRRPVSSRSGGDDDGDPPRSRL